MRIEDFAAELCDPQFGEIRTVAFRGRDVTFGIDVHEFPERVVRYELRAMRVRELRITENAIEWARYEADAPELAVLRGGGTQYLVISEGPDWDGFVGALHRRFGEIPGHLTFRYVKETLRFPSYRLPILVPKSRDAEFAAVCHAHGVGVISNGEVAACGKQVGLFRWAGDGFLIEQLTSVDEPSYVVAEAFEIEPRDWPSS